MVDRLREPLLEPVVDVDTVVGQLLLPRADRVITPSVSEWKFWDPAATRYLEATLRPGDTFVDVGAHVGYFSVLAAKLVGSSGTVIAVEPEVRNLDLLYRNLARNGCHTARVIPSAAAAEAGSMSLALDEVNRGGHRLVDQTDADADLSVACVRLDDVLPAKVDFVKIDVQGYDHEVVDGLAGTIAANPGLRLLVEFSHTELGRRGLDREAVLRWYEELDFLLATLDRGGSLRRVSLAEVLALGVRSPEEVSLVLWRPATARFGAASRPVRVPGLEVNQLADGATVIQRAEFRIHRLNPTAAVVFELCTGEIPVASIVQRVQLIFELAEPPAGEVEACLDHLRREGLLS